MILLRLGKKHLRNGVLFYFRLVKLKAKDGDFVCFGRFKDGDFVCFDLILDGDFV